MHYNCRFRHPGEPTWLANGERGTPMSPIAVHKLRPEMKGLVSTTRTKSKLSGAASRRKARERAATTAASAAQEEKGGDNAVTSDEDDEA